MFCIAPELMGETERSTLANRTEKEALKQPFCYLLGTICGVLKTQGEKIVKPVPTSSPRLLKSRPLKEFTFLKLLKNHLRFNFVI